MKADIVGGVWCVVCGVWGPPYLILRTGAAPYLIWRYRGGLGEKPQPHRQSDQYRKVYAVLIHERGFPGFKLHYWYIGVL